MARPSGHMPRCIRCPEPFNKMVRLYVYSSNVSMKYIPIGWLCSNCKNTKVEFQ